MDKKTKSPSRSQHYIKKLPDWFSLENYQAAKFLDFEGWITQLYFRLMADAYLSPIVFSGVIEGECVPENGSNKEHLPIQPISHHDAILIAEAVKSVLSIPAEIWQGASVFDFFKKKDFESTIQPSLLFLWLRTQEKGETIDLNGSLAAQSSFQILNKFISINLNAPDAILVTAFKEWLKAHRTHTKKYQKCIFSKATLQRWVSSQALPYIDLCRWAKLHAVQIPHWLMAEALFPRYHQGDRVEKVRKTTEKIASSIMHTSCLHAMAVQLQHETGRSLAIDMIPSDPASWKIKNIVKIKNELF